MNTAPGTVWVAKYLGPEMIHSSRSNDCRIYQLSARSKQRKSFLEGQLV